jgi:Domain of unknown function (DUF4430)
VLAAAVTGCGESMANPPPGPAAVRVTVTRDFGGHTLLSARAAPGQSAMNALRRVADVGTAYGGRFVSSIDGLSGNPSAGRAWLYFVNGIQADRGATTYTLHPGDREWWDYRYWTDLIQVPVAIGAWPEPFVHGFGGQAPAVSVTGPCSGRLASALRAAGATLTTRTSPYRVVVQTFGQAAAELSPSLQQGRGLTVFLEDGVVMVYRGRAGAQPQPDARGLIVGFQPSGGSGGSAEVLVVGADRPAACAAAHTLATDPAAVRLDYAVATDAAGHVVAEGGRP